MRPSVRGSYTGCVGQAGAFPSVAATRKIATIAQGAARPTGFEGRPDR